MRDVENRPDSANYRVKAAVFRGQCIMGIYPPIDTRSHREKMDRDFAETTIETISQFLDFPIVPQVS